MRTVNYFKASKLNFGVATSKGIIDVHSALQQFSNQLGDINCPLSTEDLITGGDEANTALSELTDISLKYADTNLFVDEKSINIAPCVQNPQKIICVGLNYKKHAEESNIPLPDKPILFSKFNNALCGHEDMISLPAIANEFDYEGELALVIGKEANNVSKEDALSYVYGYSIANDFSARDLQFQNTQWLLGKTSDNFCPIGPYLVSSDEIENPNNLRIKTYVNGKTRQNSNTADMIFHCDDIISFVSKHMTLYPGDVILTGTPEGVIMGYDDNKKVWLKNGDDITIEIESLGSLSNTLS